MIRTDCSLYHKDPITGSCFCTGLTEMMCAYGGCKFFKTPEQLLEQNERCYQRLKMIRDKQGGKKSIKEYTYELFSQW